LRFDGRVLASRIKIKIKKKIRIMIGAVDGRM